MSTVFIAIPAYEGIVYHGLPGLIQPTEKHDWAMVGYGSSVLGFTFNYLWCECVNSDQPRYDFFAMHHADIEAPVYWLDTLIEQMEETGADVISAVVPIKDERGLTSTGSVHENGMINRVTRKQLQYLPPAFEDTGDGGKLVINTGLMVVRLTDKIKQFDGFEIRTGVRMGVDGKVFPVTLPEDWGFSKWCHANGLKVVASHALDVTHYGKGSWDLRPKGTDWDHDKRFAKEFHYPACVEV